jgi:putative proteasome-type protease
VTYCLAMRLDKGLVFLADTRTNAGVDNVSTYRKLHVLDAGPDRAFVACSAGSLATTQQLLDVVERDAAHSPVTGADRLFEVALYLGRTALAVADEHRQALVASGADPGCTLIFGGQIRGSDPDLFLIYPEGNYVRASDDLPFLQIGESKYGKFVLELGAAAHVDLDQAARVALTSMLSTARANVSVGPPYDLAVYRNDSFAMEQVRIRPGEPFLEEAAEVWERHLLAAIEELPRLGLEQLSDETG